MINRLLAVASPILLQSASTLHTTMSGFQTHIPDISALGTETIILSPCADKKFLLLLEYETLQRAYSAI